MIDVAPRKGLLCVYFLKQIEIGFIMSIKATIVCGREAEHILQDVSCNKNAYLCLYEP